MKFFPGILTLFIVLNSFNTAFSQLDFRDPITIPDQTIPFGMVIGNFDGIGESDFAYTTDEKAYILLNLGAFNFDTLEVKDLRLTPAIHPMTSGDLNNDGKSEIIIFDNNGSKSKVVVISFQNSLFSVRRYDVADEFILSNSIKVDDYNSDGNKDIICAADSGPVQILEGSANGEFTLKEISLGEAILHLVVTDVNNDGKKDFVVCNFSTQLITYIATETSYTKKVYTGNLQYGDLVAEDFSGDGIVDVIASPASGSAFHYFVNDGSGNLTKSDIPSSLNANRTVSAGDYNKDGRVDLLAVGYTYSRVMLFQNLGDGTFAEQPLVSANFYFQEAEFIDLDNDGVLEIVGITLSKVIEIFKLTNGQYAKIMHLILGTMPNNALITHLNGDSHQDLITTSSQGNFLSVYYGEATGTWKNRNDFFIGSEVAAVDAADFNSDGAKDIVFVSFNSQSNQTGLILSNADGSLATSPVILASESELKVEIGDFNQDLKMDFVTATRVYLGNGDGTFSTVDFTAPYYIYHLDVGDINGDTFIDLFISDGTAVHYAINNGLGQFPLFQPLQLQTSPSILKSANFFDDNKADLLIGDYNNTITIVSSDNFGGFVTKTIQADTPISVLESADVNKDGRMDIVAGVYTSGENRKLAIYLQYENGAFMFSQYLATGHYPYTILAGDLNNDTFPDIVSFTPNAPTIQIMLNDFTSEPQQPSSNVSATDKVNDLTVKLTRGDGDGRIMILKEGQEVDATPSDQVFYTANKIFKIGSKIGNENYVVALADADSFNISGLKEQTTYHLKVFEYNVNFRNSIINYANQSTIFSFTTKTEQRLLPTPAVDFKVVDSNLVVVKSTSGLPVTIQVISGNASVQGDTLRISGPGLVSVTGSQAGNDIYYELTDTTFTFCVNPLKPVIMLEEKDLGVELISSSSANNQWYKNGAAILNAIEQHYQPASSGVYTVKVDVQGCASTSADYNLLITSSENSLNEGFRIYPNPSSTLLRIETTERLKSVSIYDMFGNLVYAASEPSTMNSVALASFARGIFLLVIGTDKGSVTRRIYKE